MIWTAVLKDAATELLKGYGPGLVQEPVKRLVTELTTWEAGRVLSRDDLMHLAVTRCELEDAILQPARYAKFIEAWRATVAQQASN